MGRCIGCNSKLTEGEMCAKNRHTGEYDELCKYCRSPEWDNGYTFDTDGNRIESFINESLLLKPSDGACGGDNLDTDAGIMNEIVYNGCIRTQSLY